ncbi:MAG: hypothetical protein AB4058_04405 [Microcystaceae cyanobacterium]
MTLIADVVNFVSLAIWTTPRNPSNHAKQIKRVVSGCIYFNQENPENIEDD